MWADRIPPGHGQVSTAWNGVPFHVSPHSKVIRNYGFCGQLLGLLGVPNPGKADMHTHDKTKQNNRTHRLMPPVGYEPTISIIERAKTVHALECAVTLRG
jgi:hypothetical protein